MSRRAQSGLPGCAGPIRDCAARLALKDPLVYGASLFDLASDGTVNRVHRPLVSRDTGLRGSSDFEIDEIRARCDTPCVLAYSCKGHGEGPFYRYGHRSSGSAERIAAPKTHVQADSIDRATTNPHPNISAQLRRPPLNVSSHDGR